MRHKLGLILLCMTLSGCTSNPKAVLPDQTKSEREAQIEMASRATQSGNYAQAESLLADYLYRDDNEELVLKRLWVSGAHKEMAVDTVALLLWDTKRDRSLALFAEKYLPKDKRTVMLCRLAERNAHYEEAFNCWNNRGDTDRAQRAMRTDALLRILKD